MLFLWLLTSEAATVVVLPAEPVTGRELVSECIPGWGEEAGHQTSGTALPQGSRRT